MSERLGELLPEVLARRGIGPIRDVRVFFDGACEPVNPGGTATAGWIVEDETGLLADGSDFVCSGEGATNNVAEYCALGFALRWVLNHRMVFAPDASLTLRGDSQLVVYQLTGKWNCNKEHLQKLRDRCKAILAEIGLPWQAEWIPREQNERADALSRKAYTDKTGKPFPQRQRAGR